MGIKMASAARLFGLATACAAVLTLGLPAEQANAQGEACKADVITVTGRSKGGVKRWTQTKELEGKGAAMDDAVAAWEREVSGKFGENWKLWTTAKDKSFNCDPAKGKLLMGVACTVSGRPCAGGAPQESGGGPTADARKGRWKSDGKGRWKDDDDDRGRWKRGHRGRGHGRDDDDDGTSWAYRRAMERQERLAEIRKRIEDAGWERENARQHFLLAQRKRAESRAWEREVARQRYREAARKRFERRWDDDD